MIARLDYRADLDGLRAIAVVPVILYHLDIPYVPGGFVGVDVFFVLSGFLITRLIANELAQGRFSLLGFYDRRIRRLFPALFAMLLVSSIAAAFILLPSDLERFGYTLAAAALSISNVAFWRESGYFAPAAETMPLLHTWSLAVEEQFYIVFPVFLMLLWRFGRAYLVPAIWLVVVVSFALNVWGTTAHPAPTFYLLPTRMWELALGSILALSVLPAATAAWQRSAATLVGLAAIAAAIFAYSSTTPYPGLAATLPCLGCALVIWAGLESDSRNAPNAETPLAILRILTMPPLVFVGLISYSLYLWHWPIFVFARYVSVEPLDYWDKAVLVAVIFLAAYCSWRLIEQPLRQTRSSFWPRRSQRFAYSIAAATAVTAVGMIAYFGKGFPQRVPSNVLAISQQATDFSPERPRCHAKGNGDEEFAQTCVFGQDEARLVVVLADSHGAELSYALSELTRPLGLQVRQITGSDCPPAFDISPYGRPGCKTHVEKMMLALKDLPKATIIMTAHFFLWDKSIETRGTFWQGFERAVSSLREAGHSVIILGGVPPHPFGDVPAMLAKWVSFGRAPDTYTFPIDQAQSRLIDQRLRGIAARNNVIYIPLLAYVCQATDKCRAYFHNHTVYFDNNHLTVRSARRVVKDLVLPVLAHRERPFDGKVLRHTGGFAQQ